MNGTEASIMAFFGGYMLFVLAIAVVGIIANWKLFEKANVEGWKSIIPILNIWEIIKISGLNPFYILLFLLPFVNGIFSIYLGFKYVESYGFGFGGFLLYMFFNPIMILYMGFSDDVTYTGTYYID